MAAPNPVLPAPVRAFNALGRAAAKLGLELVSLDPDALERRAAARAGAEPDVPKAFREGLRALVRALESEAKLSLLGRVSVRSQILRLLENRALLSADRARNPEIAREPITRPLFVVGLPRTGTTLLHALLAQDPATRTPLAWEVRELSPPPERASLASDPRIAPCARELDGLYKMLPEFRAIHPMEADWPQECVSITAHAFMSLQFSTTWRIPSYTAWLDQQDPAEAYAQHRRVLQHLQWRNPRERWVLKTPAHLWSLHTLFATYPDAGVIHTHRDPVRVLASTASLSTILHSIASDARDPAGIGREWAAELALGLSRAGAFRARESRLADRFVDVQFGELTGDALGVVERIYAHFGLALSGEARARMQRFIADNPREKHGVHRYRLEDFGLDPAHERRRFSAYSEQFRVPDEHAD
ncbi:MAG: sulfotransferase [Myxococcota bacterium]